MTADQNDPVPVIIWEHPSGRRVTIYPDRKVRSGYTMPDEWPVLYRSSVPSLSDPEWYAMPDTEVGWVADRHAAPAWVYDNGQQAFRRDRAKGPKAKP